MPICNHIVIFIEPKNIEQYKKMTENVEKMLPQPIDERLKTCYNIGRLREVRTPWHGL